MMIEPSNPRCSSSSRIWQAGSWQVITFRAAEARGEARSDDATDDVAAERIEGPLGIAAVITHEDEVVRIVPAVAGVGVARVIHVADLEAADVFCAPHKVPHAVWFEMLTCLNVCYESTAPDAAVVSIKQRSWMLWDTRACKAWRA